MMVMAYRMEWMLKLYEQNGSYFVLRDFSRLMSLYWHSHTVSLYNSVTQLCFVFFCSFLKFESYFMINIQVGCREILFHAEATTKQKMA